jgi:hypothetical protein
MVGAVRWCVGDNDDLWPAFLLRIRSMMADGRWQLVTRYEKGFRYFKYEGKRYLPVLGGVEIASQESWGIIINRGLEFACLRLRSGSRGARSKRMRSAKHEARQDTLPFVGTAMCLLCYRKQKFPADPR